MSVQNYGTLSQNLEQSADLNEILSNLTDLITKLRSEYESESLDIGALATGNLTTQSNIDAGNADNGGEGTIEGQGTISASTASKAETDAASTIASEIELAATGEASEGVALDAALPIVGGQATSETTTGAASADLAGETELTAAGAVTAGLEHGLPARLAELETFAFDSVSDTVADTDGNGLLPQFTNAVTDALGELQTCLATPEAGLDPVVAEAISDHLAGVQAKILGNDGFLI